MTNLVKDIKTNKAAIAELLKRMEKVENFLEFHGYLIGEHDIDQIRQDSQRELTLKEIKQNYQILKNKINELIRNVKNTT